MGFFSSSGPRRTAREVIGQVQGPRTKVRGAATLDFGLWTLDPHRFSQAILSGGRIGPSVQLTRKGLSVPGRTQPRHAPKPQPIAASVENSEGRRSSPTIFASAENIGMG